ncbi:hypothetical protein C0993_009071 [Termitomyces sp. T159_Od127]|nr:hypothetical protein C0993_009071 [Termitomyces sp. T159_Od127]
MDRFNSYARGDPNQQFSSHSRPSFVLSQWEADIIFEDTLSQVLKLSLQDTDRTNTNSAGPSAANRTRRYQSNQRSNLPYAIPSEQEQLDRITESYIAELCEATRPSASKKDNASDDVGSPTNTECEIDEQLIRRLKLGDKYIRILEKLQKAAVGIEITCPRDVTFSVLTPGCNTLIEKLEGCNHMTCKAPACNTHFCYACGEEIIRSSDSVGVSNAVRSHNERCVGRELENLIFAGVDRFIDRPRSAERFLDDHPYERYHRTSPVPRHAEPQNPTFAGLDRFIDRPRSAERFLDDQPYERYHRTSPVPRHVARGSDVPEGPFVPHAPHDLFDESPGPVPHADLHGNHLPHQFMHEYPPYGVPLVYHHPYHFHFPPPAPFAFYPYPHPHHG